MVMALSNGPAARDMELDEARFERLVQPLMDRAYQVAYQVLGDREAARDAVQEAAIAAWQRLGQLRGSSPDGWFLKIALNKARAIRRRRWFRVVRSATLAGRETDGWGGADDAIADRLDLVSVLRRLPATDRITLLLLHAMDMPHAEAARVLGLSERGVRSRERRALQRIRPYLDE
jgi:RNA polymerase sigma-70 factor, ECF subfamily